MITKVKNFVQKIKTIWPNLVYLKYKKSVRPLYRVLRPFYIVRSLRPIWLNVANRDAKKNYEKINPALDPVQSRIVGDLKEKGIAVSSLEELFPGQNLLAELRKHADSLIGQAKQREKGKTYLIDLWQKTKTVDLANPFVKVALSPKVVGIANGYMGMLSKFFMYNLNLVIPVGGANPISSQRWHRDPEDKKLCKIFIYLNDVDEETGPLGYFPESHADGKWGMKFPQIAPQGSIDIPENVIEKLAAADGGISVATGKAGTVIFGDTAGIHRGGYARSKERLMFTGGFCSTASLWLPQFSYPNAGELVKISSEEVKFALKPWYDAEKFQLGDERGSGMM